MANQKVLLCFALQLIFVISALHHTANAQAQGLKVGFYAHTCPKAEAIVTQIIHQTMAVAPSLGAPLMRMHFHDCFVRGCEGSVLLNSATNQSEKFAIPNLSLRGFQIIDKIKVALEKECPGIVSCADVLALAARDSVAALHGPTWAVETGRRDGVVSNMTEALFGLPAPFSNITTLKKDFTSRGLSVKDLAVLSGGHTIGTSHCSSFNNRLYNFSGKNDSDPTLDSEYVDRLKMKCKPADPITLVEMDPGSFKTFDVKYFDLVAKRRGLFTSDAALLDDSETKAYVVNHATASGTASFFKDFGVSMVNMGRVGVLTGSAGQIRKVCTKIN
ncbi:peroxidase 27 [Cannabis sativa]|uniref:peroxidase 27 n=1 Tax=Cannabis sativa TaxID=3483 RepID=UPI0029C9BEC4|nr:peroxidase 27 [Cannabis sativa]